MAGEGKIGVVLANTSDGEICDWVASENKLINSFVGQGYRVLLFDYRGTGRSAKVAGKRSGAWGEDAIGAAAELRKLGSSRIVLVGASTGGIKTLRTPLLFVAAKQDAYGFGPTQQLYRAAQTADKQLLIVPGEAHGFSTSMPQAQRWTPGSWTSSTRTPTGEVDGDAVASSGSRSHEGGRGPASEAANGEGGPMDHASTMRHLYELLNAGDVDGFGDHIAEDFVEHEVMPGLEPSKDGVKQLFRMYRAAFPDLRMEAEDVLLSGDKVVARVRATGTQQGEFMGLPATGKSVDVQLIDIIRFGEDGLAREHWGVLDALTMMQQLGAIPEAATA